MKHLLLIILFPLFSFGQLTVINPSFEGNGGQGETPEPWNECMKRENGDSLTPDTQPGPYGINLPPSHGNTYIGLAHGPQGSTTDFTYYNHQEGISQELSSPMVAGSCPYYLTVDLANTQTTKPSWADYATGDPLPTIGELQIYGGFNQCDTTELLWFSGPIYNENWLSYNAILEPSDNYSHILLVCQKAEEGENETAYILVDNMSTIINSAEINITTPSEFLCIDESFQIEAIYDTEGDCLSWNDTNCDKTWTASGPGNVMLNNNSINNPSIIVDAYGTYIFNYTNSCVGGSSVLIEIIPPTVNIETPESAYCSLETQLTAFSDALIAGSWSTNSNNAIIVPDNYNNTATLIVGEHGSYDVTYTNCGVSDTVTVQFEPFDPYITSSSPEECENSIELNIVTTDPNIFWEQISGPAIAEITDLNAASTQVTVPEFGIYTFGISSCDTLLTLDVAIGIPCPLEIPNTFSPNGDGVNDFFQIQGLNSYTYNHSFFEVYNRWGERVYINRKYGIDGNWWNGQIANSNTQNQISTLPLIGSNHVNDGTYYYTLELGHIIEDYPMESYFGFITIF